MNCSWIAFVFVATLVVTFRHTSGVSTRILINYFCSNVNSEEYRINIQ